MREARSANVALLLLLDAFVLVQTLRLGLDDQAPVWVRVVFGGVGLVAPGLGARVVVLLLRRRGRGRLEVG